MELSGDKKAIMSFYGKRNVKALDMFEKDPSIIPFEISELCQSVFLDRIVDDHSVRFSDDRIMDGAKIYFVCRGCQMTKSIIPYGKFKGFGKTIKNSDIMVWKTKVKSQYSNEVENFVTMNPFTSDIVIGWFLESILQKSSLITYYAYVCSNHGYKVTERVERLVYPSREQIVKIINIFMILKRYNFSWGNPHITNLYTKGSEVVLVEHSRSSIVIDGIVYSGEQSYESLCSIGSPTSNTKGSFRIRNCESFRVTKGKNAIQYDFYSLIVSFMTSKEFRDTVNIDDMWESMWRKSEFSEIMRIIRIYNESPPVDVILSILSKFTLNCSVIENSSRKLSY
uniref:Uncharacterized protein n=1 Tax=Pithovirus LCPAC403 TaxID=2506596 RepID=A0A481ZC00_9VIRU|nr:MAG: uncharacterized protein LCPAC403_01490 [Pithovirus LCPAC403]